MCSENEINHYIIEIYQHLTGQLLGLLNTPIRIRNNNTVVTGWVE